MRDMIILIFFLLFLFLFFRYRMRFINSILMLLGYLFAIIIIGIAALVVMIIALPFIIILEAIEFTKIR